MSLEAIDTIDEQTSCRDLHIPRHTECDWNGRVVEKQPPSQWIVLVILARWSGPEQIHTLNDHVIDYHDAQPTVEEVLERYGLMFAPTTYFPPSTRDLV